MGVLIILFNVFVNFVFFEFVGFLSKIFLFKLNNVFVLLKIVEFEFL